MALVEPRPRRGFPSHFHVRALGHASLIGRCRATIRPPGNRRRRAPARCRALPRSPWDSDVVGLVVHYVAWLNNQGNVFVGIMRAQRIEQTKSNDAWTLNLCGCHDGLPLFQHRREHDQSLNPRHPPGVLCR